MLQPIARFEHNQLDTTHTYTGLWSPYNKCKTEQDVEELQDEAKKCKRSLDSGDLPGFKTFSAAARALAGNSVGGSRSRK